MFGLGLYKTYGNQIIDIFGGIQLGLIYTLVVRLLVGVGWFMLFKKQGKNPWLAFVPIVGPYIAFRMVCDDFSWAAIFGMSTFLAWVTALGIDNVVVGAFAVINFIMWWALALMSTHVYQVPIFFGFIYGAFPWLGVPFFGFSSLPHYTEPIDLAPKKTKEERQAEKKAAKKARKEAQKNAK